jgi:hypothetical protein
MFKGNKNENFNILARIYGNCISSSKVGVRPVPIMLSISAWATARTEGWVTNARIAEHIVDAVYLIWGQLFPAANRFGRKPHKRALGSIRRAKKELKNPTVLTVSEPAPNRDAGIKEKSFSDRKPSCSLTDSKVSRVLMN